MKQRLTILILSVFLVSCSSTYFYSRVNTEMPDVFQVENGDFVFENDSLWIAHSFNGEDAPILITVYNKMDTPLYIDWAKSALIVQDESTSYYKNVGQINSTTNASGYNYGFVTDFYSETKGNVAYPENISFIPPRTKVSKTKLRLNLDIRDMEQIYQTDSIKKRNKSKSVKRANFTPENSPLKFTSYLTLFSRPENPMVYEQDFYMSSLIKTNEIRPKDLPKESLNSGDMFYVVKYADNSAAEVLLGITIIAGAAYLDAKLDNNRYNNY